MKKIYKNIIGTILFLLMLIFGASILKDLLILIFKDTLNKNLFFIIHFILIYIMIILLLKTKSVKSFGESLFGKKKIKMKKI
jgi:hypothetical protein